MPSDLPTPEQWNIQGGWIAAYQQAVLRGQVPPTVRIPPPPPPVKEEPVEEPMQGGWKHEGKEPPVKIRICPKCQGNRKDPADLDKANWCEDCQEGKTLGTAPKKPKNTKDTTRDKDGYNVNSTFFS